MAICLTPITATLLFLLALLTACVTSTSVVSELSTLQSQSPSGVIHLADDLLHRIISIPTPRPFTFLVFFDARKLQSNPRLSLRKLMSEYSLVSSSFLANNPHNKSLLFFFDVEYEESQASFSIFGVKGLPHMRLVPPSATDLKSDSIHLDPLDFSKLAESIASFIESKTKLSVRPIVHPPLVSKTQVVIVIAVLLAWTPFVVKKLVSGNTILHEKYVWMAGAIFVYFFSVSGAMFNIIRKMPMFIGDRKDPSKFMFFSQAPGMQLGAEGFSVGSLYTIVGLLLAFVTHGVGRLSSRTVQRVVMMIMMFVSFLAVQEVVYLANWKTGYHIRGYWPTSWQ